MVIAAGASVLAVAMAATTASDRDAGKMTMQPWVPVLAIVVVVAVLYAISRWMAVRGEVNRKTDLTQQRVALKSMSAEDRNIEDQVARTGFLGGGNGARGGG